MTSIPFLIQTPRGLISKDVRGPVCTVGTHESCHIRVKSVYVSKHHIQFYMAGTRLKVKDMGSKNGIQINGTNVSDSDVVIGDKIEFGDHVMWIDEEELTPAMRRNLSQRRSNRMNEATKTQIDYTETEMTMKIDRLDKK